MPFVVAYFSSAFFHPTQNTFTLAWPCIKKEQVVWVGSSACLFPGIAGALLLVLSDRGMCQRAFAFYGQRISWETPCSSPSVHGQCSLCATSTCVTTFSKRFCILLVSPALCTKNTEAFEGTLWFVQSHAHVLYMLLFFATLVHSTTCQC